MKKYLILLVITLASIQVTGQNIRRDTVTAKSKLRADDMFVWQDLEIYRDSLAYILWEADSFRFKRVDGGWSDWFKPGAGTGEENTASSQGSGTSIFYQKSGVDLQFNGIKSENSILSIALDGISHDVELTIDETAINHNNLSNYSIDQHRIINDSGTGITELWSADKISSELAGKEPALTKGNLTETGTNILTITGGTGAVIGSGTSIQVELATNQNSGYLSNTDWVTFNSKQDALTFGDLSEASSNILTITGGTGSVIGSGTTIQVEQATGTTSGFLSSTDWSTFNDKVSNATHSGDVSGSLTLTIGDDKVLERHLKAVNAPTDEYVLTYEATTGDFEWQSGGAGSGETNTASSQGSGTSIYYQKDGVDLQFNGLKSENSILSVSLDGVTHDVEFTVDEAAINHNNLTNYTVDQHRTINDSGTETTDLWSGNKISSELAGKEPTLTKGNLTESTSSILTITGGTGSVIGSGTSIQVGQATSSSSGYLSSADWNTFNNKLSGNESISLSGDVSGSGSTSITTTIGAGVVEESMLDVYNTTTDGYILSWNDSQSKFEWVQDQTGSGVSALADLSDVTSALQSSGYVIISDGGNYYGRALTESDISDFGTYLISEVDGSTSNELQTLTGDVSSTGTTLLSTTIGAGVVEESMLDVYNSPTDGFVIAWNNGQSQFEWVQMTGGTASLERSVNQTTHGFSVDDAIYKNGSTYAKALGDDPATAGVIGIVTEVTDANNFTYTYGGTIPGTWTDGTDYFLSNTVAGDIITEPSYNSGDVRLYIGTGTEDGLQLEIDVGHEIVPLTDNTAIHTDGVNEISSLISKASPVSADLLVIEDSEGGYAKKKVLISNLPGGSESDPVFTDWDKSTGISISASQVSDFDTEVSNNTSVSANTSKVSYPGSASATELNILDGATITTTEINYLSGVSSNIQTQLDSKLSSLPKVTKSITIEDPTSSENIAMFYVPEAMTISNIYAVVAGTSPSVTINPVLTSDRSASGTAILSSATAITNTTSGQTLTSFNDATVPAGSWIVFKTTATSGTVDEISLTIAYDID